MAWEQLVSILHTAQDESRQNREAVPEACPIDGWPLQQGPDGVLFCVFDGWTYTGAPDLGVR